MAETFIKESDYNKLAKLYKLKEIDLNDDEYAVIADFDSWANIRSEGLKHGTTITLNGKTLSQNMISA